MKFLYEKELVMTEYKDICDAHAKRIERFKEESNKLRSECVEFISKLRSSLALPSKTYFNLKSEEVSYLKLVTPFVDTSDAEDTRAHNLSVNEDGALRFGVSLAVKAYPDDLYPIMVFVNIEMKIKNDTISVLIKGTKQGDLNIQEEISDPDRYRKSSEAVKTAIIGVFNES